MASEELREIFNRHFCGNPADFVVLLMKTRDRGLALEDLDASYSLMYDCGVTPSLQAFEQFLFHESASAAPKVQKDIEECANYSLTQISALLEPQTDTRQQ